MAKPDIVLVPWDPESPEHIARLIAQRVQCGWDMEKVDSSWVKQQKTGLAILIASKALLTNGPNKDEILQKHVNVYPKEVVPLLDTSVAIRNVARNASGNELFPVGHISLDVENPAVKKMGIDLDLPKTGCYWVKTFYVSSALRSQGIGRAAMDIVETMATEPPLNAKVLALDTVHKEDQRTQDQAGYWSGTPKMTNQEWYTRRGYFLIKTVVNFYISPDPLEATRDLRTVFMRRDVG